MTTDTGDDAGRRRIVQDLDANFMVVAGAGTGKTTALVSRIVALVRTGTVPLRQIAAITFTEAAAAELRHQIRGAIDAGISDGDDLLLAARDEVDDAAICTLHSFAERILREHCLDAGLPPGFEVLDDTAEAADFDERWSRFADALLEDPDAERALVLGFSSGLRPTDLTDVAWSLHAQWDRLEDGGLDHLRAARPCDEHWPLSDPAPVIDALDRAVATIRWCTDDEDKMALHLRGPLSTAHALLTATGSDARAVLPLLDTVTPLRCAHGRQENWGGHIAEVRSACADADQARLDLLDAVRRAALGDLVARLASFTLDAAEERRHEGRLTFHDLLVHARRLVRARGDGLSLLQRRYRRLLIDEFQDTDPIQVELAAQLAAAVDTATDAATDVGGARPGALFVVGDPRQSIYRFRRADIELFDRVGADIGSTVALRTNFRSVPGIVDFVNVVFEEIFGHGTIPGQATHHALSAARPVPPVEGPTGRRAAHEPDRPAVVQLSFEWTDSAGDPGPAPTPVPGRARHTGGARPPAPVVTVGGALAVSTPEVRRRAAGDAASAIGHIVGRGWSVQDPERASMRATRWRDIAVLIPARSSLPALEDAFEDADIPYRLEGAALLWGADEVRQVLTVLGATDDSADAVAVLGALRSPGLACGDDDLVTWHAAGGRWDPRAVPPPGLETHPVAEAMAVLERLRGRRSWAEPSAMVAAAIAELHSFELALAHRRPRDHWQRLRWLLDQARLFDEAPGGTLRAFLAWAGRRAEGDGRVGGVGPPDPDDDAVRVMTIHGAKGLEFPVVVVAGLERDQSDGPGPPAVVWTEHHIPEVHVGPFRTAGFEQAGLRAQRLDVLEQHRLLYVAMTRARDHLVLCLHHKQRNANPDSSLAALVTKICTRNPALWRELPDEAATARVEPVPAGDGRPREGPRTLPVHWETERTRMLTTLRRRPVTTATAVARRAATDAIDAGAPYEAAVDPGPDADTTEGALPEGPLRVGRAVHAALADLDLSSWRDGAGRSVDEVAATHALAHGVHSQSSEITAMVRRALASPTVAHGARRRHWREVPVTTALGAAGVLEGFVDLVVEDDDGLVVIDYKTDRPTGPRARAGTAARYRLQVAAYAVALEASTGISVVRCVLVFVGSEEPTEHVIAGEDLADACRQARRVADGLVAV
jgi:ATP-dependent helicase/nuclease subunit A